MLDIRALTPSRGMGLFSLPPLSDTLKSAQVPIHWILAALRINKPEREDDRSLSSIIEVKNIWSFASVPPVCLNATVLRHINLTFIRLQK
jgi:hypothetical protein